METNQDEDSVLNSPSDLDLLSLDKLDRASPDLWPQSFSGLIDLNRTPNATLGLVGNTGSATSKWMSDLDKNDIEILNELSTLQTPQLIDKVKDLFDFAYQLGSEESNQMTRGRLLNILETRSEL